MISFECAVASRFDYRCKFNEFKYRYCSRVFSMSPCINLMRMDGRSTCDNVDSVWCGRFSSYFNYVTVYYQFIQKYICFSKLVVEANAYSVFKRTTLLIIAENDKKSTVTRPWFRLTLFRSQRRANMKKQTVQAV